MTNHIQNHIHLSDVLGTTPENAPTYKWVVNDRNRIPVVPLSLKRSKTFKLFPNVLRDGITTDPINLTNFRYRIRIQGSDADNTQTLIDTLQSWLGETLYLVDVVHPNDGEDHTTAIRPMILSAIPDGFKTDDWGLYRYFVTIELEDASR